MIQSIFPSNSFCSKINAPNKKDIFKALKSAKVDITASEKITWNKYCDVKVEVLYIDEISPLFFPTLEIFFKDFNNIPITTEFSQIWRNTYYKGGYQEVHDHCSPVDSDISGCFFLEDHNEDAGKFYFYNRDASQLNVTWRKLLMGESIDEILSRMVAPEAGDVLLFPSYVLHGVTPHQLSKPRTTVSFNLRFL